MLPLTYASPFTFSNSIVTFSYAVLPTISTSLKNGVFHVMVAPCMFASFFNFYNICVSIEMMTPARS